MSETKRRLTLTDFLLARIAEDEAVARAANSPRKWRGPETMGALEGGDSVLVDPARVLAECAAKRAILHRILRPLGPGGGGGAGSSRDQWGNWPVMDVVLRSLVAPYSSHPDYDPSWRPD